MKQMYICRDTVTGLFSGIYDAWKAGKDENNAGIVLKGTLEQQLFCEYTEVEETEKKAVAVEHLIKTHLGSEAYFDIYHALLSESPDKGNAVFGTMLEAKRILDSRKIMQHLAHPDVGRVFELKRSVANEAHFFVEFVRFRELENQVLFSEITPKAQVLTCIADHFSDRLPLENFMIYDKTHKMFLVHRARKNWVLVQGEELNIEAVGRISAAEKEYSRLWKGFFHSISIKDRENRRCQRQHLPVHFRQDMVEFQQ